MRNKERRLEKVEHKAEADLKPGNEGPSQEAMVKVTRKIESDPDFKKHFDRLRHCIDVTEGDPEKDVIKKLADKLKGDPDLLESYKILKRKLEP